MSGFFYLLNYFNGWPLKVKQGEKTLVICIVISNNMLIEFVFVHLSRKVTGIEYFNNLFIFCSSGRQEDSEMTGIITVVLN